MDFYEKKKRAVMRILELLNMGKSLEVIYYKILIEFGFGKSFVDDFFKTRDAMKEVGDVDKTL